MPGVHNGGRKWSLKGKAYEPFQKKIVSIYNVFKLLQIPNNKSQITYWYLKLNTYPPLRCNGRRVCLEFDAWDLGFQKIIDGVKKIIAIRESYDIQKTSL
jgi:hypothetical protein